jgi:hypothetical protein
VFEPFPDSVESTVRDKITGAEIEVRSFRDSGQKNHALVVRSASATSHIIIATTAINS